MKARDYSSLHEEWKEAATGSDIGLSWIAQDVRELLGAVVAPDVVRKETLRALEPLLRAGDLRAVDLLPGGAFKTWDGDVTSQLARIDAEWTALPRPLSLGDIVWFVGPR